MQRRNRLRISMTAALALALTAGLAAVPPPAEADVTFPFETDFDGPDGGVLLGHAAIADGRLRLTSATPDRSGAWITADSFPSALGLDITFRSSIGPNADGGDGLAFFLADGAAPLAPGAFGAGLGYSCKNGSTGDGACTVPGVPGGYLGIGLDRYGNFSRALNGSGPGRSPDTIAVRGSGDGTTGYAYRLGAPAPGGSLADPSAAALRTTRVLIEPTGAHVRFTVWSDAGPGTPMETVFDAVDIAGWAGQTTLPPTLRLGFSGSTGSAVNTHEVDELRVDVPTDLAVTKSGPAETIAGESVRWEITAANVGPSAAIGAVVTDAVPGTVSDVTWTCAPSGGATCVDRSGSGNAITARADLPRGSRATYTVTGTLDPSATGSVVNTATVHPPTGHADADTGNDTATTTSAVLARAELRTDKEALVDGAVAPGDRFGYRVTATNAGPSTAVAVGATDRLPDGIRFVDSADGCRAVGQDVTCGGDRTLRPGETVGFAIRVALDAGYRGDGSDLGNVAVATSPTDPDGASPSDEVFVTVRVPVEPGAGGGPGDTVGSVPSVADRSGGAGRAGGSLAFTGTDDRVLAATTLLAVAVITLGLLARLRRRP